MCKLIYINPCLGYVGLTLLTALIISTTGGKVLMKGFYYSNYLICVFNVHAIHLVDGHSLEVGVKLFLNAAEHLVGGGVRQVWQDLVVSQNGTVR